MSAACSVKAVVTNTKGKSFHVEGKLWSDGTLRLANPRPKRYPEFQFLLIDPRRRYREDPKRLYWLETNDSDRGGLSPFRLKSMLLSLKQVKKKP